MDFKLILILVLPVVLWGGYSLYSILKGLPGGKKVAKKSMSGVNITLIIACVILAAYFFTGAYKQPLNKRPAKEYPISFMSFERVDGIVGCKSKYSDEKKKDLFNSSYRNNWMTWSGTIETVGNGKVSINCDGKGTQDLSVKMADKNSTYHLEKGQAVNVKFLLDSPGGCFLPFGGREGTLKRLLRSEE